MKQNNSAIMQMIMGKRGNLGNIPLSEEYHKAMDLAFKKYMEFRKQIEDNPKLLTMCEELEELYNCENAVFIDDVYREAFAFGLAMGQEVFDK